MLQLHAQHEKHNYYANKKIINHQKIILQEHAIAQENNNAHLTKMSNQ